MWESYAAKAHFSFALIVFIKSMLMLVLITHVYHVSYFQVFGNVQNHRHVSQEAVSPF